MRTINIRGLELGIGKPKICIPIVGSTREAILEEGRQAMSMGAELVEWRVDHYDGIIRPESIPHVLGELRGVLGELPLIFTFRTVFEGGNRPILGPNYLALNTLAINSGFVDLVDVEVNREPEVVHAILSDAHDRGVKVIGSCHDFKKTPTKAEMLSQLKKSCELGADVGKLAVMPHCMEDVLSLLLATCEAPKAGIDIPLITMSMGAMGSISRVCGEYFGSAVTFGAGGAASAPGQLGGEPLRMVLDILHTMTPKPSKNIFLIGFMGTGKSTVAKALGRATGMEILEMDAELERRQGRSIPRIFEEEGEEFFRDLESALLEEIKNAKGAPRIISCGGGAILREENRARMEACGHVVLLSAQPKTVFDRIGGDVHRPNIKDRKTVEEIAALMDSRREKYEAAAHMTVMTDDKSADEICAEILRRYYV